VACGVQGHHPGNHFFAQVNCSLFFIAAAARDEVFGQGSPPGHFFLLFFAQVDCFLFFCTGHGMHAEIDVFPFFPPSATMAGGPTV